MGRFKYLFLMNMSVIFVMTMLMHMLFSSDMEMGVAVFLVLNDVSETDNHIYKAESNKKHCSNITAERFE